MINRLSEQARQQAIEFRLRHQVAFENSLAALLSREFKITVNEAARVVREEGTDAVQLVLDLHQARLGQTIPPFIQRVGVAFGELTFEELAAQSLNIPIGRLDAFRVGVYQYSNQVGGLKVVQVASTTRDRIGRAIGEAVANGLSRRDTAKLIIERTGGQIATRRALTIAQTETHSAAMHGDLAAMNASGYDYQKEWLATGDARTRQHHADADGQKVPKDQPFHVGGELLQYPGDPEGAPRNTVNCRCQMLYETL